MMVFYGISRVFDLTNEAQYETIGQFWDEMAAQYGLENLQGLGYQWRENQFFYAIGLKSGHIPGWNVSISLPDDGWDMATGRTEQLKEIYDDIYRQGRLQYEIETFFKDGTCQILYYRTW